VSNVSPDKRTAERPTGGA